MNTHAVQNLKKLYRLKKNDIVLRLNEFKNCRSQKSDEDIFAELTFCLLTPQSKATCCWGAIESIRAQNLLIKGTVDQIKQRLHRVRFHNKKALYIVEARRLLLRNGKVILEPLVSRFSDVRKCRDWLVSSIKGLGYKEASHFLRNIGLGDNIAILDRHILRNLHLLGIIDEIPESLGRKKYLEVEDLMSDFAKKIRIPLDHLDLLLWYKETGEIFK